MSEYNFDIKFQTGPFEVGIDTAASYGYFEHDTLGDNCGGGLWFEGLTLVDADGTSEVPREVVDGLRLYGYFVDPIFGPDEA